MFGFLIPDRAAGPASKELLLMDLSSTIALWSQDPFLRNPIPGSHPSLRNILLLWLSLREGAGKGNWALDFWAAGRSGSPIYPPAIPAGILASAPQRSPPKPHRNNRASGTLFSLEQSELEILSGNVSMWKSSLELQSLELDFNQSV